MRKVARPLTKSQRIAKRRSQEELLNRAKRIYDPQDYDGHDDEED